MIEKPPVAAPGATLLPEISLIVTGGDRMDELQRLLVSLSAQRDSPSFELVLIDQTGAASKLVDDLGVDNFSCIKVRSGNVSLSSARNLGLERATGKLIGFPDDDCWYPEGLLAKVATTFAQDPRLGALCTCVYDPDQRAALGARPRDRTIWLTDWNLFRLPISVGMFVRRECMNDAGGRFRTDLGAGTELGSGEETELMSRILDTQWSARYDGSQMVFHALPVLANTSEQKLASYGRGFGFLIKLLIKRNKLTAIWELLYVLSRTTAALLIYLPDSSLRAKYYARLSGIASGLMYRHGQSQS